MPDQRSVMKEFRSLEQKRASQGLTPAEEARLAKLRELIGPEAGAGGLRGGFDVNAAAARLRDSLLPAGLRNRPPPPEPPPEAAAPEPELSPSDALANAYAEQAFTPLEPAAASDALFDPSSLGQDAPASDDGGVLAAEWDANAGGGPPAAPDDPGAGYDPAAQGYGEAGGDAAAAGWDPTAQAPEGAERGEAWEGAASAEGQAAADAYPGAAGAEGAPAWDPNAPLDPNAPPAWDASQPYDPNAAYAAAPYDPGAPAQDPNAAPGWDPSAPFDPNAPPAWDPSQPYDLGAPAYDPNAPPAWDAGVPADDGGAAAAVDAAFDAFAAATPDASPQDAGWDPSALAAPEPAVANAGAFDRGPQPPEGWEVAPPGPDAAPAEAPLGEYDESASALPAGEDAGLESMLPFDPAAEAALGAGAPEHPPALGEYDDTAGFSAFPEAPPADLPVEGGGFEAAHAVVPSASEDWHPETAVEDGFQLESGGSFDAAAAAVAPEWAVGAQQPPWEEAGVTVAAAPFEPGATPPADAADVFADAAPQDAGFGFAEPDAPEAEPGAADAGVEAEAATVELSTVDVELAEPAASAPTVPDTGGFDGAAGEVGPADGDLGLDPEARAPDLPGHAPALDFSRPDLSEGQPEDDFAPPQGAAPEASPVAEEEIPTIDGEEILEEIPAEDGAAAPALSLDFEPLVVPPPATPAPPTAAAVPIAPAPAPPPAAAATVPPPPTARAAPPPVAPRVPAPLPAAPARSGSVVEGVHRVVVHTVEGQVKRGVLEDADLAAASLGLAPQPGGAPELVGTDKVKAIFFMLAPGERPPAAEGSKVRVTFRDGRQIAGFSPDYDETGPGFFMVPGDTRTNTGRIWVYRASVKQVSVS